MATHQRFHLHSLAELEASIRELALAIPVSQDMGILGTPVALGGGRTAWNRFAVHPMEGFDATDGAPGPLAFRRYERYAAGGAAVIWFEATAVVPEARSNPGQFWISRDTVATFTKLVAATRAAARAAVGKEPILILQLTHSGRYSKPTGTPEPMIAHHSPILDPIHKLTDQYPLVSDDYLDALQDRFVEAAQLAAQAGFDGVDVKSCHRYLLSELLASFTRPGKYGGSYDNRTRMLRETLGRIRAAGTGLFVTTRLGVFDAISYPYGFGVNRDDFRVPDLSEPLQLVQQLRQFDVPLLNISVGNPYYNPHYGRPFDFPVKNAKAPEEHPLQGVDRLLQVTRTFQEKYPDLPILGTGYAWLRQFMPQVAAAVLQRGWATFIGQGRGSFAYPDAVRDILGKGAMDPAKCCVSCSACTQIMRDGGKTGCVVRDSDVYGPQYRLARRFALDHLQEEARRCRDCEQATCVRGCPAQIDIPAFVRAFADGDIAKSYAILKARNLLPEMCGKICPAAEQCQGHCIEQVFCEQPLPIQDIQLVVSRLARLKKLTGVQVPAQPSGRKMAVIGGGPAGLACTVRLLELGHEVHLWDKSTELGGTPDSSIPDDRFADSRAEVQAVLAPAIAAGRLILRLGVAFGHDITLSQLRSDFAACFLGFGLAGSTSLGQADGVVSAVEFLAAVKNGQLKRVPNKVAVIGAGNTAMDAAVTARRLGARDVYLVYRRSFAEMPAWAEERDRFLATGGHLMILTQPLGYDSDAAGKVCGVRICRTELGEPDKSGRRAPLPVPDSEGLLSAELVIEAIGQTLDRATQAALAGVELTRGGLIALAKESQATSLPGVFAGGDIVNGGKTAVQAIADGMYAAEEMHRLATAAR